MLIQPECPFRTENYCSWLSERTGRLYHVSPIWCRACCGSGGPCGGRQITQAQEIEFLHASWWRLPPINNAAFAKSIIERYKKPYEIQFPKQYDEIKRALEPMRSLPGFRGILLTGSMLARNAPQPLKDYDVILWFADLKSALASQKVYRPPEFVGEMKMDYFYNVGGDKAPDVYFASLDPERKILYTSRWFKMNIAAVHDGIVVVEQEYAGLDAVLERMPEWLQRDGFMPATPCRGKEKPILSVIITVLNDQDELTETIKSIRATSPKCEVEIIVVDDASDVPAVVPKGVTLKRNEQRMGCGASRHIGVEMARADYVLLTDSHMRFVKGWYDKATTKFLNEPTTLWCAVCLGLDAECMDVTKHRGAYFGADFIFENGEGQVFEGKWTREKEGDDYEISCVMGACYFIPKEFFLRIGGLKSNWLWGVDEQVLSLKTWLAGGSVRLMKEVQIGHKFRDKAPYRTNPVCVNYNKLRAIAVLCPQFYEPLKRKINDARASAMIRMHAKEIREEREQFQKVAVRDMDWFCEKFGIPKPEKAGA